MTAQFRLLPPSKEYLERGKLQPRGYSKDIEDHPYESQVSIQAHASIQLTGLADAYNV